jgi:metal-sulfur cluster biosynthetic enzyme
MTTTEGRQSGERVRDALREIVDPCSAANGSNLDIVEMGLLKSVEVSDGDVRVEMRLTTPACHMVPYFIEEIEERVGALSGVESVEVETDDGMEWREEMMSEEAKEKRQAVIDKKMSQYTETE